MLVKIKGLAGSVSRFLWPAVVVFSAGFGFLEAHISSCSVWLLLAGWGLLFGLSFTVWSSRFFTAMRLCIAWFFGLSLLHCVILGCEAGYSFGASLVYIPAS